MTTLTRELYTAHATVSGGRQGRGTTSDGALEVDLRSPEELGGPGGGTNPEQLFAVGYAACFSNAMLTVGRRMRVDVADHTVTAKVKLGTIGEGRYGLAVAIEVGVPSLPREQAEKLVQAAHQVCPYSNATKGNIDVTVDLV